MTWKIFVKVLLAMIIGYLWYGSFSYGWAGPYSVILHQLVGFIFFTSLLNLSASLVAIFYRLRKKLAPHDQDNITFGINNLYLLIISFAAVLFLLSLWGIDFRTLFTSLSIIAAAIAIISREFLTAIIAGLVIAVSKELSIGDYIKIGEQKGKIIDLSLTKIAVQNEDDDVIFIPNDKAYHSEIINYSKGDDRRVSVVFELDSKFKGGVEELEENLILNLSEFGEHLIADSFRLKISDIKKDAVSFKFQYTLHHADQKIEKEVKRKTIRKVLAYIKSTLYVEG